MGYSLLAYALNNLKSLLLLVFIALNVDFGWEKMQQICCIFHSTCRFISK